MATGIFQNCLGTQTLLSKIISTKRVGQGNSLFITQLKLLLWDSNYITVSKKIIVSKQHIAIIANSVQRVV